LYSAAVSSNTWRVVAEDEGPFVGSIQAQVICASGPGAAALALSARVSPASSTRTLHILRAEQANVAR
jgi:hypothetical protein